jgi:hypothetical protein
VLRLGGARERAVRAGRDAAIDGTEVTRKGLAGTRALRPIFQRRAPRALRIFLLVDRKYIILCAFIARCPYILTNLMNVFIIIFIEN